MYCNVNPRRVFNTYCNDRAISSYTGFNILISTMTSMWCRIMWATCQQSTPPATEMSTVNEVLTQTLNIMSTLELNAIVWVLDQVLYFKAAYITWKYDKFKNIIFRMGAFHTIPFETFYTDHLEEVSGCWPPRLVCVVCRDFRRINHSCDGRAQIQSCCQASQDPV